MAVTPYPFVSGAVLTASQLNSTYNVPINAQTVSYTLVAADGGKRVQMNAAGATTITVNTGLFAAGDSLFIQNIGAGTCTITAGTCAVTTSGSLALAANAGGTLYFTSASAAIYFSAGVAPAASGLVFISSGSFSATTTINLGVVFTATYKTYEVVFQVTTSVDCQISVRVNNAGTPRTGADYAFSSVRNSYQTDSQITKAPTGTSMNLCASTTATIAHANLKLVVFDPMNASAKTKIQSTGVAANDSNEVGLVDAGGVYNAAAEANDGLTFIAGGNITGIWRVYGLSES